MTLTLMAVRQEVNNFENSVIVQELEFAMNLALYGNVLPTVPRRLFCCGSYHLDLYVIMLFVA